MQLKSDTRILKYQTTENMITDLLKMEGQLYAEIDTKKVYTEEEYAFLETARRKINQAAEWLLAEDEMRQLIRDRIERENSDKDHN